MDDLANEKSDEQSSVTSFQIQGEPVDIEPTHNIDNDKIEGRKS